MPFVEIDRSLELWYPAGGDPCFATNYPHRVPAPYSILDNGNVRVFSRAYEGGFDGPLNAIADDVRNVDGETNVEFDVRFPEVLGGIFEGDDWIIRLDELVYSYAPVSDSRRRTLLALSRTPTMNESLFDESLVSLPNDRFNNERARMFPQRPAE